MKKLVFILSLLLCQTGLWAQVNLERQVISNGSLDAEIGNFYLGSTVGESVVQTFLSISGTLIVTQGFRQPIPGTVSSNDDPVEINLDYAIFPNPTRGPLNIELETDRPIDLEIGVFQTDGKETTITTGIRRIQSEWKGNLDLGELPEGLYLLGLRDQSGRWIKVFRISKLD